MRCIIGRSTFSCADRMAAAASRAMTQEEAFFIDLALGNAAAGTYVDGEGTRSERRITIILWQEVGKASRLKNKSTWHKAATSAPFPHQLRLRHKSKCSAGRKAWSFPVPG